MNSKQFVCVYDPSSVKVGISGVDIICWEKTVKKQQNKI